MSAIQVNGPDLLKAVKQLGPKEFDAFLQQAVALRHQPKAATLSAEESRIIKRINRGLPEKLRRRYSQLVHKRDKRTLTRDEHAELLKLTHDLESRDAERAAALLELAKLRRVPLRVLMKQMGIKAAPVHG